MKSKTLVLCLGALVILLVGSQLFQVQRSVAQQDSSTQFPLYLVDGFGRNVTIERAPERIISLSPGNTEILFAIGAGTKVVGVTRYCDYPPEVVAKVQNGSLNVVGGWTDPNIEVIVSLHPDLILTSGDLQKDIVTNLEAKGLTVFTLVPRSIWDILQNIQLVGRITDCSKAADEIVNEMKGRIQTIVDRIQDVAYKPRVYFEVYYDPLMGAGPGTYVNDLIELAGGINILSDSKAPYPMVNSETIIQLDPQIIIVGRHANAPIEETKTGIESRPGWTSISAVRNGRIYEIDENIVYRDGPRLVDGLEALALMIHPELFPETGFHKLVIQTSPRLSNIGFSINGVNERTDANGTITQILRRGSYTVRILNQSLSIGSGKIEFLQWTGASSERNPELILDIENDTNLTANYHSLNATTSAATSTLTTDFGGVIPGCPVGSVIAGLALGGVFLVLKRQTRRKSVRCLL